MLVINVPADIEERLTDLAARTGETREHIVQEALVAYIEDLEDALIAMARLKSHRKPSPLEEWERQIAAEQDA